MKVLIAASGDPTTFDGKRTKYESLAREMERQGHTVRLLVPPEGGWRGAKLIRQSLKQSTADVVVLRGALALVTSWPTLVARFKGKAWISIERPSPVRAGIAEVWGSDRPATRKALMLGLFFVNSPWLDQVADRVIEFADDSSYFGLGTKHKRRRVENWVETTSIPLAAPGATEGPIRLVVVASLSHWHGVDRVIEALSASPTLPVHLTVVGDGPARAGLEDLVQKLGLSSRVEFLGRKIGSQLDAACDGQDIAVGVLGLHRAGLEQASPLKHRDYLARGLPIIYSGCDHTLDKAASMGLARKVPADDSPVDLVSICSWAEELRKASSLRSQIRQFAEEHASPKQAVVAYLPQQSDRA